MIVGPFQFERPEWLILAPVLIAISFWISRKSMAALSPVAHRMSGALRAVAFILVAAALAEPSYRLESDDVAVIVVEDRSRSMPRGATATLTNFLERATAAAPVGSRMGYVTAARQGRVHALPMTDEPASLVVQDAIAGGRADVGPADATDLEQTARLALAIKPEDAATRMLLVSDGNETSGSLVAFADTARSAGVPIDVVPVTYTIEREVRLDELITPATARAGQTINVRFAVTATQDTTARLRLTLNGTPVDLAPGEEGSSATVSLRAGSDIVSIPVLAPRGGPARFEATIEPLDASADSVTQNNAAQAITFLNTEGSVLVYTDDETESAPLVEALERSRLKVETRSPRSATGSLVELQGHDAIVLFDLPAGEFSRAQQTDLAAYVRDAGGGLIMVGGPRSFGAGGWLGTPVAEVMPVEMEPPQKRELPQGVMVVVLDVSGSMASPVAGGNWTQIELAGESTIQALKQLGPRDKFGMVIFAGGYQVSVPLTENDRPAEVARKIRTIGPMGGTDMFPAIGAAMGMLGAETGRKHVLVISDGQTGGNRTGAIEVIKRARQAGVTLSTIAMGDQANYELMTALAEAGGGRALKVTFQASVAELPQLITQEFQEPKRSLIWEGDPFTPRLIAGGAESLRGIRSPLPSLTGYVVTGDRAGLSQVTVRGPHEDPIVAQWQHGLGRSIAFTSDATARWSAGWLSWEQYRAFWEQHVRWAMRPSGSANVALTTETRGDTTRVIATALDGEGEPLNFARFVGRVSRRESEAQEITLQQTGNGRYEGAFSSRDAGAYLISLRYDLPTAEGRVGDRGTVQAAVMRSDAEEHRHLSDNAALLVQVAAMTGGRVLDPDPVRADVFSRDKLTKPVAVTPVWMAVALAAMGAFLMDVAVRRVRIDVKAMRDGMASVLDRTPKAATELAGLAAARSAARERMTKPAEPVEVREIQIVTPMPPTESGAKETVEAEADIAEEAGMSRLLAAKRRASERHEDSA